MCEYVKISGWLKTSFIDYPGTVSTVLFLSGCNLRCPFCHNPGIVNDELPQVAFDEVKQYLIKRKHIVEGVVISGGEPTLHPSLPELVRELKNMKLRVKIDTNGLLPEMIEKTSPDYLALDIKTVPEKYRLLGADMVDVQCRLRKSISMVEAMGENGEVRIPVVPGLVDDFEIEELKELLGGVRKVFIQPFKRNAELLDPAFSDIEPHSPEKLKGWCRMLRSLSIDCHIRGMEY
ncbi:Ribonucleotide reductase of class III (anaerobic), activating protein [Chitinispirillum alkaliphilum]|nr:Ribonucleotide reductase of class III (anaerobic), activating protein [Chitinispirillum alkaliphilum]